jgi:CSLREA domain-containing protein
MKFFPILFVLIFAISAQAATFTVTRTDDRNGTCNSGDCSLRETIKAANLSSANDTVNFASGLATVTLTSEIVIENNGTILIQGFGANISTISGGNVSRIFYTNNAIITVSDLTLTKGNGIGTNLPGNGGAIFANGGSLTLERLSITKN